MRICKPHRKIILDDGSEFWGNPFGDHSDRIVEIVFNTSMVGYQEILSDPSYTDQGVVMTYPLIGNYGIAEDDFESFRPTISAMIVRQYNEHPSNFRSTHTLEEIMRGFGIVGVSGVDTRALARHIRNIGSCQALITSAETPLESGIASLRKSNPPHDAVSRVSCKCNCRFETESPIYHVVAIDCGMKQNIVRALNQRGCTVTSVPWNTSAASIDALKPDGVLISNGPGDPTDVQPVIITVRQLLGRYPIFGICLGHQILSLVYGAETFKLKFGHRGGNHPVRNLLSGKVEITSQNHSYAVKSDRLSGTPIEITHINLHDGTIEGIRCMRDRAFGIQYHPESAPGPQDSGYLFDDFIDLMKGLKPYAKTY